MAHDKLSKYYDQLDIGAYCCQCEYAQPLFSDTECLCSKYGVVDQQYHCRHFTYDLLKRKPHKRPQNVASQLTSSDFVDLDET